MGHEIYPTRTKYPKYSPLSL